MSGWGTAGLNFAKKALLACAAVAAALGPFSTGILIRMGDAPALLAQSPAPQQPSTAPQQPVPAPKPSVPPQTAKPNVGVSGPELQRQSQQTERLAFEVASVKPNKAGATAPSDVRRSMMLQYLPGGRFSARGVPIPMLIFEAYSVAPGPSRRITVSPEFEKSLDHRMESETYDIEAVAEKGAIPANASIKVQREKIRRMLQTLLADRFKVRITREIKEVPVYAIAVGSNGPKLQKSAMDEAQCAATSMDKPEMNRFFLALDRNSCHMFVAGEGRPLRGQAITMSDLAHVIEELFADRPVVDQTGLNGIYKIDIPAFQPLRPPPPPPPGTEPTAEARALTDPAPPTLAGVLKDLGLKLESAKAPVEMFVVEHFERPTQN